MREREREDARDEGRRRTSVWVGETRERQVECVKRERERGKNRGKLTPPFLFL